ncbi:pre-peptidase C-terminal domain-containing protein [Lysobacter brunescens]|uniref:Pre-peptidase C-terminal domain-containing protein n=1 Tax=Lysobacter brunescens TaxID=262323 RepID=A0ABW2YAC9_9GAMM
MRHLIHPAAVSLTGAALAALLSTTAPAHARQRTPQLNEPGAITRTLPVTSSRSVLDAGTSSRVCEAGAKWIRLDFRSLKLHAYDSLVLKSSGGDRYVFQGGHWNDRSFSSRALRGSCVDIQPYFASGDSGYELGGYTAGTRALALSTVVVAGAGDLCDSTPGDCKATSDLIVNINPVAVFTAGDNAYSNGTLSEFNTRYDPNWGRFKSKTKPTPGNHEYGTANAAGYFDYFNGSGVQTGLAGDRSKGYYSWDVGDWHFVALNTMSGGTISSTQLAWLKQDLAANTKPCTAAYFHHPRWSTGNYTGYSGVQSAYTELYAAKADLILVGHDHNYQRSKKINASGAVAADGFRQILVGTGGRDFYPFGSTNTTIAEVRNANTWGVLKLTLSATDYVADFVPVAGSTFTDRVTGTCNRASTGTTYSISGTVTNSAGTGIAGVTVSNGSASATTSSTGAYTLPGLANGTYTLTPSLSGYTFSPVSRSVTVNGANVTGQTFTGTATSSGGTVVHNVALPSVSSGNWSSTYTVSIPAGTTKLVVDISGGTGDADLYVRAGSAPTTSSYNCRPYLNGNTETCTVNNPVAGTTYYIAVRAYSSYSGVTMKATRTP